MASVQARIEIDAPEDAFRIGVNPAYLSDAVRALDADRDEPLEIRFIGPPACSKPGPIVISPVRRRDRIALVMPMRMERDEEAQGES